MKRFTIRQLMLVIAGVAVLMAGLRFLSWALFYETRCLSRRTQCASNLRNLVLAVLAHNESDHAFPAGTWPNPGLPPEQRLSWCAPILTWIDHPEIASQIAKDRPWFERSIVSAPGAVTNWKLAGTRFGVMKCPDQPSSSKKMVPTVYIGIAGLGTDAPTLPTKHPRAGIFGYDRVVAATDIKDGASTTMMIAESSRTSGSWLAGGPATVRGLDTVDLPYLGRGRQFGGLHGLPWGRGSGANVAFADGSVRFISDTIAPRVFEALSTIAGGEMVTTGDLP